MICPKLWCAAVSCGATRFTWFFLGFEDVVHMGLQRVEEIFLPWLHAVVCVEFCGGSFGGLV